MRELFDQSVLPLNSLFIGCSSHEERCLGIARQFESWQPGHAILFHYDDPNPRREANHLILRDLLASRSTLTEVTFTEQHAVRSFREHREALLEALGNHDGRSIVMDVSVFTKRHLLLLLRCLDDFDGWNRLWITYSEPEEYEIEGNMPLSFGVSQVEQVPGFSAAPDPSRPLHVAMLLGYEGDRAFATYDLLQPRRTTLVIPDPPFRASWKGRTESLNRNLLAVVDETALCKSDALDPESTYAVLEGSLGPTDERSEFSRAIAPLGTKPQIFGAYLYLRLCIDPPAVIYSGALRHNHSYYSRGIGNTWLIHRPH